MYSGKGVHRGTLGADDILVRHGEQIALIHSQLHVKLTEGPETESVHACTRAHVSSCSGRTLATSVIWLTIVSYLSACSHNLAMNLNPGDQTSEQFEAQTDSATHTESLRSSESPISFTLGAGVW
jgi:hypothetical protein